MHVNPIKYECLFGCQRSVSKLNIDDISHYLTCPRLWSHVCQPRGVVSDNILARMGLNGEYSDGENDIDHAVARMAVSFKTYNFLRIQNAVNVDPNSANEIRAPIDQQSNFQNLVNIGPNSANEIRAQIDQHSINFQNPPNMAPNSAAEIRAVVDQRIKYGKNAAAVAASRRALRLPNCLVGGAGPRGRQ